jgi:Ca2+-transporting ATPase
MLILLLIACSLYFILGKISEGWMRMAAMLFVAAASVYQDVKSTRAIKVMKELTVPKV